MVIVDFNYLILMFIMLSKLNINNINYAYYELYR